VEEEAEEDGDENENHLVLLGERECADVVQKL